MTVASAVSRVSYSGNGSTTAFAVPFYFLENAHLRVILRSSAGVETVQTITTNYTVTGAGNPAGGTVNMIVAPASGETLVILRDVPETQETDYTANDPFPAESHERALDKLTMITQQIGEESGRAIKIPETETSNTILPSITDRAGRFLYFDNLGNANVSAIVPFAASNMASFRFVGTGSQVIFPLAISTFQNSVVISIDGVHQNNDTYTISGSTLTFSEAPPINSSIEIVIFGSV